MTYLEELVAFDGEAPLPTDIKPVEDTGGDESLRVSGEEIKPTGDDAEEEEDWTLPESREQPILHILGIFFIAREFVLEHAVFISGAQDHH